MELSASMAGGNTDSVMREFALCVPVSRWKMRMPVYLYCGFKYSFMPPEIEKDNLLIKEKNILLVVIFLINESYNSCRQNYKSLWYSLCICNEKHLI